MQRGFYTSWSTMYTAGASRSKTNFGSYSMSFKDTANFKVSLAPSEDLRHQTFTFPSTSRLLTSHSSLQKPTTVVWFWPGLQTVGWHYHTVRNQKPETLNPKGLNPKPKTPETLKTLKALILNPKHPKPLTLKALILNPKHPKPLTLKAY